MNTPPRTIRDLDALAFELGLTDVLADDGQGYIRIAEALKRAAADRSSRQDWAVEAMNLDLEVERFRTEIADAVKLPPDTGRDLLVSEVQARFAHVVRAVVGHRLDHGVIGGQRRCECGIPVTPRLWIEHVNALRAEGAETATAAISR